MNFLVVCEGSPDDCYLDSVPGDILGDVDAIAICIGTGSGGELNTPLTGARDLSPCPAWGRAETIFPCAPARHRWAADMAYQQAPANRGPDQALALTRSSARRRIGF